MGRPFVYDGWSLTPSFGAVWTVPLQSSAAGSRATYIGVPLESIPVATAEPAATVRWGAELAGRFGGDRWRIVLGWQSGAMVVGPSGDTPGAEDGVVYGGLSFSF